MICKNCANIFSDDLSCCPECGTPIKGNYNSAELSSEEAVERIINEVFSEYDRNGYEQLEEAAPAAQEQDISDNQQQAETVIEEHVEPEKEMTEEDTSAFEKNSETQDNDEEEEITLSDYEIENSVKVTGVEEFTQLDEFENEPDIHSEELEEIVLSEADADIEDIITDSDDESETFDEISEEDDITQEEEIPEETVIPTRSENKKPSAKEKKAMNVIVSLTIALAAFMGALIGISLFTDVFEEDDAIKTVALSGLSSADTESLEEFLSDIGIVMYAGYDRKVADTGSFISYFNPSDPGSICNKVYGSQKLTVNEEDPAKRFANENGDYSFYVVEESYIDSILEGFGLSADHTINEKDCYYYNGNYYFANKGEGYFSSTIVAQVNLTKRTVDGTYYAECSLYDENESSDSMNYLETYILFNKVAGKDGASWEIIKISHEPIFNSNGVMQSEGEDALSYEIKSETITNTDEEGKIIARCVIEYPFFSGRTAAEKAVNQLYSSTISAYKENPGNIKRNIRIVARVTYNEGGYLSIVEETATGTVVMKKTGEGDEAVNGLVFPIRTVEGYILEVETGDNLTKKDIIKKQYHTVEKILYRIYKGYGYESLVNEDAEDEMDIPRDDDNLGQDIYNSPCALCEKGFTFFFLNEERFVEEVVIPYGIADFYNIEL